MGDGVSNTHVKMLECIRYGFECSVYYRIRCV